MFQNLKCAEVTTSQDVVRMSVLCLQMYIMCTVIDKLKSDTVCPLTILRHCINYALKLYLDTLVPFTHIANHCCIVLPIIMLCCITAIRYLCIYFIYYIYIQLNATCLYIICPLVFICNKHTVCSIGISGVEMDTKY